MAKDLTTRDLIQFAVARSLFAPTTLARAVERLGFVQADPIRAPARAQDLTLRPRVRGYRAGDLERCYGELDIDEDYFINYGFVRSRDLSLMLPRTPRRPWDKTTKKRAQRVLEFVQERGHAHPRDLQHFALGTVTNAWGGTSSAAAHLLDGLHYRGLLRVHRREAGIRVYAPRVFAQATRTPQANADALLALAVKKYAPVSSPALGRLASRLRYAAPQLVSESRKAVARARRTLPRAHVGGVDWYWPVDEAPPKRGNLELEKVRFLAPFDPLVWDRERFETFWGWAYRFEAYTPVAKRKIGYYALPLLWRDQIIGWANARTATGELTIDFGYVSGRAPRDAAFVRALEAEVESLRSFLRR